MASLSITASHGPLSSYRPQARQPTADYSRASWVETEYRTHYKEPWYKGGSVQPRVPSWCDRVLYTVAPEDDRVTVSNASSAPRRVGSDSSACACACSR
jgi:hypothetical protein